MLSDVYTIKRVKHRIERTKCKLRKYEQDIEGLSKHGHQMYGYYKGVLYELETILDILEENQ